MPTYRYRGLDTAGKSVQGQLSALDDQSATAMVKSQGLFPMELRAIADQQASAVDAAAPQSSAQPKLFGGRFSSSDLAILTRQLANLVSRGVPMMTALSALTEHAENPYVGTILTQIQRDVQSGKSLQEALGAQSRVFSPLYISMVKAGESSGQLSSVLDWLAEYHEKDQARRLQIRGALIYPTMLVTFGLISIYLLIALIVPKFIGMFEEFDQALPLPTVILINVSHFASHWGWGVIAGIVLAALAVRAYGKTPHGRFYLDSLKMRVPLFGKLGMKSAVSRFSHTLATLLHGGVPLLDALAVVRDVLDNEVLARATDHAREGMREGERFGQRLKETQVFPALLTHMVSIGEETGDLQGMLQTVAGAYDIEVETTLKGVVSLMEPVIIISLGAAVAFVVIAMLLPIFSLNIS